MVEMVKVGDDVVRPGNQVRTAGGYKTVCHIGRTDNADTWVYCFKDEQKSHMFYSACDMVSIIRTE